MVGSWGMVIMIVSLRSGRHDVRPISRRKAKSLFLTPSPHPPAGSRSKSRPKARITVEGKRWTERKRHHRASPSLPPSRPLPYEKAEEKPSRSDEHTSELQALMRLY